MRQVFYIINVDRIQARAALALAAFVLAVVPAVSWAQGSWTLEMPPVAAMRLDNGLWVISIHFRPELPVVRAEMIVEAGAVDDPPGKEGLAELTAALVAKGTSARTADDIAGLIESAGGAYVPTTSMISSSFAIALLKKDIDTGLEVLADVLMNPVFPDDEIFFMKSQVMAGVRAQLDDPHSLALLHLNRLFYGTEHRAGRRTTEQSIAAISREDLIAFHRDRYAPGRSVLVIAGAMSHDEAFAAAEKWFGAWPAKETPPAAAPAEPAAGTRVRLVEKPGMTQLQMALAFPGVAMTDSRMAALSLAEHALTGEWGSRLFKALRGERGLVYFVSSVLTGWSFPGDLTIHTASGNDTWEEALNVLLDELSRFREGLLPDELEQAKAHAIGSFPLAVSTTAGLASLVAQEALYGGDPEESVDYVEEVRSITLDEVNRVIRDVIDFNRMAVVLVGDPAALEGAEEAIDRLLGDLFAGDVTFERVDWLSVDR